MKKACKNCKQEMQVKPSQFEKKNFCSKKCQYEHRSTNPEEYNIKRTSQLISCSFCNKEFSRKPSEIKDKNYCSQECRYKAMIKPDKVRKRTKKSFKKSCEFCHKEFFVEPFNKDKTRFCSTECFSNSRKGIELPKKTKEDNVNCDNCGNWFYRIPAEIKKRKHHFCCKDCMSEYYKNEKLFVGENSGTWTGGSDKYYGKNWHEQRRKARKRDNYTCQDCGITEEEYGQELSVHHLTLFRLFDDYREANKLNNLVSICEPCHRKRHTGENHPVNAMKIK